MRDIRVEVGALNITMHPHSPEKYVKLLRKAAKLNKNIPLRGEARARIGMPEKLSAKSKGGPLHGDIIRFTHIDADADWFNIESKDVASDDDKKDLSIPGKLKPNMSKFSFIFYPDDHLLVFEAFYNQKSFSPSFAVKLFDTLLNQPELSSEFGNVKVTPLPDKDKLTQMLSTKGITSLTLITTRPNPNPDMLKRQEGRIKQRFSQMNIIEEERSYKAIDRNGVELDEELKLDAQVAAKNGEVKMKYYTASGTLSTQSTKEHSLHRTEYYSAKQSPFEAFLQFAAKIKEEYKDWIR